jgi:hypothetical protein
VGNRRGTRKTLMGKPVFIRVLCVHPRSAFFPAFAAMESLRGGWWILSVAPELTLMDVLQEREGFLPRGFPLELLGPPPCLAAQFRI